MGLNGFGTADEGFLPCQAGGRADGNETGVGLESEAHPFVVTCRLVALSPSCLTGQSPYTFFPASSYFAS
jgi:hypothetical protein